MRIPADAAASLVEPMAPILRAIEAACASGERAPLMVLIGILDAAREMCLAAVLGHRISQSKELSHAGVAGHDRSRIVADQWLKPIVGAQRLGISMRTLTRRARRAPYSSFCIPQPGRGFMVSAVGLEEHMRRERRRGDHQ